jgi:hypothetical protein
MLHFFTNVPFEEMPLKRAFGAISEKFRIRNAETAIFTGFLMGH